MARPKEAILSKNLIRDQALAIIDEDGLGTLTMRGLATRLGVQAASLYTHFANKEAVLDAIANRLAKRIDPTGFDAGWQAGLRTWANSYHAAIHWHPNAAPIVAAGARHRAEYLAMADQVHSGLVGNGWPADEATKVAAAVTFLVLGAATTASGQPRSESSPAADTMEAASFSLALDSLVHGLERVYAEVATEPS